MSRGSSSKYQAAKTNLAVRVAQMDSAEATLPPPRMTGTHDSQYVSGHVVVDETSQLGSVSMIQPSGEGAISYDHNEFLDSGGSFSTTDINSDGYSIRNTVLMQGLLLDQSGPLFVPPVEEEQPCPPLGNLPVSDSVLVPQEVEQAAVPILPILHAEPPREAAICTHSKPIVAPDQMPDLSGPPVVVSCSFTEPLFLPGLCAANPTAAANELLAGVTETIPPTRPNDIFWKVSKPAVSSIVQPSFVAIIPNTLESEGVVPVPELQLPEVTPCNHTESVYASLLAPEAYAVPYSSEVVASEQILAATASLCELPLKLVHFTERPLLPATVELDKSAAAELLTSSDASHCHSLPAFSVLMQPPQAPPALFSAELDQPAVEELPTPTEMAEHSFREPSGTQTKQPAIPLATDEPANSIEADVAKPSEVTSCNAVEAAVLEEVSQVAAQPKHEAISVLLVSPKVDTCGVQNAIVMQMQKSEAQLELDHTDSVGPAEAAESKFSESLEEAIYGISEPPILKITPTVDMPEILSVSDSARAVRHTSFEQPDLQEVAAWSSSSALEQSQEAETANFSGQSEITTSSSHQLATVLKPPAAEAPATIETVTIEQSHTITQLLDLHNSIEELSMSQARQQLSVTLNNSLVGKALKDMQLPKQDQGVTLQKNTDKLASIVGGISAPHELIKPTRNDDSDGNLSQNARAPISLLPVLLKSPAPFAEISPFVYNATATTSGQSTLSGILPKSQTNDMQNERQDERTVPTSHHHVEHVITRTEIRLGAQPFSSGFAQGSSNSFRKVIFNPGQGLVSPPVTPTGQEFYAFPNKTVAPTIPGASPFVIQPSSNIAMTSKPKGTAPLHVEEELTSHADSIPMTAASSPVIPSIGTSSGALTSSQQSADFQSAIKTSEQSMSSGNAAELHGIEDERQAIRKALQVRKKVINTWQPENSQADLIDGNTLARRPSVTLLVQQTDGLSSTGPGVIPASRSEIPGQVSVVPGPKSTAEIKAGITRDTESTVLGRFQRPVIGVRQVSIRKEN